MYGVRSTYLLYPGSPRYFVLCPSPTLLPPSKRGTFYRKLLEHQDDKDINKEGQSVSYLNNSVQDK